MPYKMMKTLYRAVALALIPCLLVQPGRAAAQPPLLRSPRMLAAVTQPFDREALSAAGLWILLSAQPVAAAQARAAAQAFRADSRPHWGAFFSIVTLAAPAVAAIASSRGGTDKKI